MVTKAKPKKRHKQLEATGSLAPAAPPETKVEVLFQGTPCERHAAGSHYLKDGKLGCHQCDRERDDAEVERIVQKIKAEREAEAARRPPYFFIDGSKLRGKDG